MWRSDTKFADNRATATALFAAVVAVHLVVLAVADLNVERPEREESPMAVTFSMVEVVEEPSVEEPVEEVPEVEPEPVVPVEPVPPVVTADPAPVKAADPPPPEAPEPTTPAALVVRAPMVVAPVEPDYRGAIVRRLEERKIYPAAARTRGIEGAVTVSFTVRPDGRVRRIRVETDDVHRYLQQAAAESVRKAAPFPLPGEPEADIDVVVTIAYRLEE